MHVLKKCHFKLYIWLFTPSAFNFQINILPSALNLSDPKCKNLSATYFAKAVDMFCLRNENIYNECL